MVDRGQGSGVRGQESGVRSQCTVHGNLGHRVVRPPSSAFVVAFLPTKAAAVLAVNQFGRLAGSFVANPADIPNALFAPTGVASQHPQAGFLFHGLGQPGGKQPIDEALDRGHAAGPSRVDCWFSECQSLGGLLSWVCGMRPPTKSTPADSRDSLPSCGPRRLRRQARKLFCRPKTICKSLMHNALR